MKKTKKQKIKAEKRRIDNLQQVNQPVQTTAQPQPVQFNLKDFFKEDSFTSEKPKSQNLSTTSEDYSYLKRDLTKIGILSSLAIGIQLVIFLIIN